MWAAAFGIAVLYVGSTILTPLYPIYRREFGFSELVVTEIYAIYVVGNLTVLFVFGRLSDQIGRRRTTLLALGITVLSALCFLLAKGTIWLFPARILNGFAAGPGPLILAEARHSMILLVGATIISGAAMAIGYCGSPRIINRIAPEEQRADVVSSYLLVCYSANSLPVIGVGLLSLAVGAPSAHRVFAIAIAAPALIACITGLRYAPRAEPSRSGT
jgi:MFS family permease